MINKKEKMKLQKPIEQREKKYSTLIKETKSGVVIYFLNDSINNFTEKEIDSVIEKVDGSIRFGLNATIKTLLFELTEYRIIQYCNQDLLIEKR